MADKIIAEIAKNSAEVIRVSRSVFHGHDLVDCRVYALDSTGVDEPRPTKKGLSLRPETWLELLPAIREAAGESAEFPAVPEGEDIFGE